MAKQYISKQNINCLTNNDYAKFRKNSITDRDFYFNFKSGTVRFGFLSSIRESYRKHRKCL